jgi:hypothetical protein
MVSVHKEINLIYSTNEGTQIVMWNLMEDGFYSFTIQRKSYLLIQSIYIEIITCRFYVLKL